MTRIDTQLDQANLFYTARALLLKHREVSVSALQRHLRLPYSNALALLDELEIAGIVTASNVAGFRTLSAAHLVPIPMSESLPGRLDYVARLHETCLCWMELFEEGHQGHSELPKIIAPTCFSSAPLRQYLFEELYGQRRYSLTEAALALSAWEPEGVVLPYSADEVRDELITRCAADERTICAVANEEEETARVFRRFARAVRRIVTERGDRHSRLLACFVRDGLVPVGEGHSYKVGQSGRHIEHVVPLVFLLEKAIELIMAGWHVNDVARYIRHFVAVVHITSEDARRLDGAVSKGGFGLKTSMPLGWEFETGCVFDRLHVAGLAFDFAAKPSDCSHCISH